MPAKLLPWSAKALSWPMWFNARSGAIGSKSSATGGDRESAVACSLTCGPAVRSIGAKPAAAVRAKCTAISVVQSSIDLGHISFGQRVTDAGRQEGSRLGGGCER